MIGHATPTLWQVLFGRDVAGARVGVKLVYSWRNAEHLRVCGHLFPLGHQPGNLRVAAGKLCREFDLLPL